MQANEAIERLREELLYAIECAEQDGYEFDAARNLLAATATIDPPAAPVLAAVGVEAQHQVADFCPECHAREGFPDGEELARFLANEYLTGVATTDDNGPKVTLRYKTMVAADAALDAIADAVDGRIVAQPAAGHAKRAEGERAAFEAFARDACLMPPRAMVNWDAVWTKAAWEGWQARGQQADVPEAPQFRVAVHYVRWMHHGDEPAGDFQVMIMNTAISKGAWSPYTDPGVQVVYANQSEVACNHVANAWGDFFGVGVEYCKDGEAG